jgi:ubiquinone biosynthesis protein
MSAVLNIFRLAFLFLLSFPLFIFSRNRAIYFFLHAAGPSFIKLGQVLSIRPDLVGENLAKVLSSFQDDVAPAKSRFDEDFLKNFSEFDLTPVAAASIAQVHKARLKTGELVAVKTLRPRIAAIMNRDIKTLRILQKFLPKIIKDLADLLSQVAKSELDLLAEAANASRLREDLSDVKGFYVPQVFWKFSTSKILVLEWLDGTAFSNSAAIKNSPFDKKEIARNLVISYFNQVYMHGFFHADMHPGNLFLLKNGDIGVVDFGIMGQLDKKMRLAVAEILIGFLHKNYRRVAQIHLDAGLVPANTNIDQLALSCRKIGEMIIDVDVKDISVAKLLTNLIQMTNEYQMETKPDLLLLQKTLLVVEGVGVMLDPNLNMWEIARPWVKEWAKKNIGFDAKIRDAVVDLFELAKKFLRSV